MERSLYLTSTSEILQAEVTPANRGQLVHKVQPGRPEDRDLLDPRGRRERRAHKDLLDRRAPLVLRVLPEAPERPDRRALPALRDLLEPLARSDQLAHKDLPDRRARPGLRDLLVLPALSDPRARKVPLDRRAQQALKDH